VMLLVVATSAALQPALSAARVQPASALKHD
jgi:ABC-type lipoprotein release transport system permease subunit